MEEWTDAEGWMDRWMSRWMDKCMVDEQRYPMGFSGEPQCTELWQTTETSCSHWRTFRKRQEQFHGLGMETFTTIVLNPQTSCGLFYPELTPTNMVQNPTGLDSLLGVEAQKFSLGTRIFFSKHSFCVSTVTSPIHTYSTPGKSRDRGVGEEPRQKMSGKVWNSVASPWCLSWSLSLSTNETIKTPPQILVPDFQYRPLPSEDSATH